MNFHDFCKTLINDGKVYISIMREGENPRLYDAILADYNEAVGYSRVFYYDYEVGIFYPWIEDGKVNVSIEIFKPDENFKKIVTKEYLSTLFPKSNISLINGQLEITKREE